MILINSFFVFLKKPILFLAWIFFSSIAVAITNTSSSNIPSVIQQHFNTIFNSELAKQQLVGAIVGVYCDGKVQYFSYGKTAKNDKPPTSTTIYQIGSITKVFTSTLLAEAVVNQKLDLEDSIDGYLPNGIHLQPAAANKITFLTLATHTASLPNALPYNMTTPAEFFNYLSNWQPPYAIGTRDKYSNVGFQLLDYLLITIEKQSYQQLLINKIAQPLGMQATQTITQILPPNKKLAQGYNAQGQTISYQRTPWDGTGFLISNAQDLMRFVLANLNLLPVPISLSKAIQLTQLSYFPIKPGRQQGLAWEIFRFQQPGYLAKIYWKNGSTPGFSSFIGFNPQRQTGIVILVSQNQQVAKQHKIASKITKMGIQSLRAL